MRADRRLRLRAIAALVLTAITGVIVFGPAGPARAAAAPSPIEGDGSSYAAKALLQWARDELSHHLSISYTPSGSAQGRQDYAYDKKDFAGTDIAYIPASQPDPFAGSEFGGNNAYSYIPDVAGGLSFMYNLVVQGHKITNMRLSGKTIALIFTGNIKNWDDSRITHDYGAQLPSIPITVATRSDGAGESYFLTRWMLKQYPGIWVPFCKARDGGSSLCSKNPTENYPGRGAGFKSLNGADNITGFVSSAANNGAIGYAEYAYPRELHLPVVSMLNPAGYYVQPTAANVAIALESAKIDENPSHVTFLMQNLDGVYTSKDPRSYPLSAYSYLIVPRDKRGSQSASKTFTNDPGRGTALSTYAGYMLCQAQQSAVELGYSPLPKPMVQGGFVQYNHIPNHVPNAAGNNPTKQANYASCNNPAYKNGVDLITRNAPYPNACQKVSAPLDCKVVGGKAVSTAAGSGNSAANGNSANGNGAAGNGAATGASSTASGAAGSGVKIDPNTGQVVGGSQDAGLAAAHPVFGLVGNPAQDIPSGVLAAVLLIAAVGVPAGLGAWLQRAPGRRRRDGGRR